MLLISRRDGKGQQRKPKVAHNVWDVQENVLQIAFIVSRLPAHHAHKLIQLNLLGYAYRDTCQPASCQPCLAAPFSCLDNVGY